ncbi:DUF5801 repeats-in-toxin domain-containing protein [Aminobacter carboxidus]|uniref:DUF5801 repeats-in-toxin domain-containing protein n=1 Tax=Aminobacter carboxidus TaxID=376165 RepID=UPI001AEEA2DE
MTYSYTLANPVNHTTDGTPFETFTVNVADSDGNPADDASAAFQIQIIDDVPSVTVTGTGSNPVSAFALNLDETVQPDGASSAMHDRYRAGGEGESTPSAQNGGADDVLNTATPELDYIRVPTVSSTIDPAKAIGKLTTSVSGGLASLFGVNPVYGADGPAASGSLTQSLTLSLVGATILQTNLTATALAGTALSGLTSAQRQIYLQMEGGMIVGRVPGSNGIGVDDAVAFRISVTDASNPASAQLAIEQFLAIDHGGTENPSIYDEVMSLLTTGSDKVQLTLAATITDGDGDSSNHSASVDLVTNSASAISFDDDGPIAGVDATVNTHSIGNAGTIVNGDIVVDYGTDGRGTASIALTSNPATLTFGGTALIYDNSNPNVLVAHTGTLADPVFTLTLNPATGAYTFQSFKPLDGVINADVAIGGAFGAGPTSYQVLTSGAGGTGSHLGVVSAWTTGAGFNVANWKTGSTSGVTVGQVNGGTNGWGVGNQNFDAAEILRFDFGQQVDFDGAGAYVPPSTGIFNGPNVSEASFNFANAGSSDTIHYVLHYTDGTTASGQFDVGNLTGANFEPTAPAGKYFDYIEFYAQDGSSKLDLQSVTTISTTIDIDLDFNVTVRDGDGDALSFPIHVDIVNGAPSAGAITALIDEDSLANGVAGGLGDTAGTATASGTLAFSFGPDGAAAIDPINFSPMHNLSVVDTGNVAVMSGGAALSYYWDSATDTLYGATNITSAANALATAAFKVTLNTSDGSYQYTQIKPLDHPGHDDPSSPATELSYEDTIALALRYQVKDANGDSAQGTLTVSINDDTPTAGPDSATLDIVVDDLGVGAIVATWTNVQMTSGSPVTFDRDGDGSTDEIRWPTGSGSGYGFIDNPTLANTPVTTNETFYLGEFTHFNFPVSGGTLTSTTLSVTFTALINGEQVQVGPILVNFTHNETTNTSDPEASRDIITIATSTTTVNIDGQNYTLDVRGFVDTNGDIVSTVRTYESQQNSYQLAVRFVSSDSTSVTKTGDVISGSDASGADTPLLVAAITHGATTDSTADGSGNFQVSGDHGTLVINKNGTYTYTLTDDASDIPAGASETFTYTVKDADGDAVSQTLTINLNKVDSGANPLHGDRVLTNISGGSGTDVVISDAALLYNDDAGSTVNGSVSDITDATSVINAAGAYTFKDNDTDGGRFTYGGQNGATTDNAIVTVDRSQAGSTTLTGTSFSEILIGSTGNDTISAGDGNDYVVANGGNDTIDGGAGADALLGGAGNDSFVADAADKLIDGGADSDTLNVGANFTSTGDAQIANIENITLTTAATLNLANQTEAFTITGSSGADTITSGSGGDTIVGASNDTLLDGGAGTDTLNVAANFTSTSNAQIANIENVTLTAAATLNLANQSEAFTITGSSGNDTITGGSGADSISAGGGTDTINAAQNDALIDGGGGTDTLQIGASFTSTGNGQIVGVENIVLTSAATVNLSNQNEGFKILGSSGIDAITGSSGADTIHGGSGNVNDTLTGGGGADQFRLATNTGADTIGDFTQGTDKIAFFDNGGTSSGSVNFANTTGTATGAALDVDDFSSLLTLGSMSNGQDSMVLKVAGGISQDDIEDTEITGSGSPTNNYVVVFNTTSNRAEIWFDSNWDSDSGRTKVATLNNITTLAQYTTMYASLSASDIAVYSSAVDPIMLDLDNNGYSFSDVEGGIRFDINADGIADQVAWNTSGDGILAYDVNGDGKIDSGAEIFTPDFAGGKFASGAEALASLDSNGDGIVDADDEAFSKLLIWQDANSDGVGEAGELTHLADHGITGLGTSTTASNDVIDGQQVAGEGAVLYADGSSGTYVEVMLEAALGTPETSQSTGETYVIEGLDVADIIPDYDGGKGDQLDLSALLSGLAPDTDLAAQGYVSVVQNGTDAEVKVDVDGGGDSFQTVAVLENFTAVNEAVKVLFEDNAGTKHQDNI